MGSVTAKGYPYPVGTDRLMDGDNAIQALAEAADAKAGVLAAGTATVPITALNTPGSVSSTFPVGRFTTAPAVVSTVANVTAPERQATGVTAITPTGFTTWGTRTAGSVANVVTTWIARVAD